MDKTPGQIAREAYVSSLKTWDELAAAVIAHARPQIEAEIISKATLSGSCGMCIERLSADKEIRMLKERIAQIEAEARAAVVCVPVEKTQK